MNKHFLAMVFLQGVAVAAFAQAPVGKGSDANPAGVTTPTPSTGTTSRADVKAEAKEANKAGASKGGDANPSGISTPNAKSGSTTTRAEVKADTKAAAARGELQTNDASMPGDKKAMKKKVRKNKMRKSNTTANSTGSIESTGK